MNMELPQSMFEPQFDKHVMQRVASRANLCSLSYNLLHILIGRFHCAIHLGQVRYQIMMLDLESSAYLRYHVIVQVETTVRYDSLWKFVSTYDFFLDEPGHHCLCHTSI